MCIQFIYINNDAASDGSYQLVLLNQRDEFYKRPTQPAHYWQNAAAHCIGGTDQEPGKEGGTWFAVSTRGKAAVLLNISAGKQGTGRGSLVRDYVTSDIDPQTYLQELKQNKDKYSSFNLVLLNRSSSASWHLHHLSTEEDGVHEVTQGFHAFGNSSPAVPFTKVKHGKDIFKTIIENHPRTTDKDALVDELFQMMSNTDEHLPDEELQRLQGSTLPPPLLSKLSSICVSMPAIGYGTRTTTLVLVDANGHCDYIEKTMREPIDCNNVIWDKTQHEFDMKA